MECEVEIHSERPSFEQRRINHKTHNLFFLLTFFLRFFFVWNELYEYTQAYMLSVTHRQDFGLLR